MILIRISGGLGNQMFQYALYEKMRSLGKEVRLDLSFYEAKNSFQKFELDLFPVSYETASKQDLRRLADWGYGIRDRIGRKLFGEKKTVYREDLDAGYQPQILNMDEKYLDGYWQCERYFSDIREDILKKFTFPDNRNEAVAEIEARIRSTCSVSIHIRRGDYLNPVNDRIYGNICTLNYYKNAMAYMRRKFGNVTFFVFTNDAEWVKTNLMEEGMVLVDTKGAKDCWDMYLMSICNHNIIANSSFSWWGAWLNQNPDKIVAAPEKWFNNHPVADAICESWIKTGRQ